MTNSEQDIKNLHPRLSQAVETLQKAVENKMTIIKAQSQILDQQKEELKNFNNDNSSKTEILIKEIKEDLEKIKNIINS